MKSNLSLLVLVLFPLSVASADSAWSRHAIDSSLRGADGVRLADFDGDGLQDIVTGWEESGIVRLYLNPGTEGVKDAWPAVTVGQAGSPEDAVPMDIDGDGQLEVVSCHEGRTRKVLVHRNASANSRSNLLEQRQWTSREFTQLENQQWMFGVPITLGGKTNALIVGSKGNRGSITLLTPPRLDRGDLGRWKTSRIRDAGWIMSLQAIDMDGDGDEDLLYSDRKGENRGVGWLEQPESATDGGSSWTDHLIGGAGKEDMFIDGDADLVLVPTRDSKILKFWRTTDGRWQSTELANPPSVRFGKAVKRLDDAALVFTSNTAADRKANPNLPGAWLWRAEGGWSVIDPTPEVKLDRIECLDMDGDGDLDFMTCEERRNLGVIWYENPRIR